LIFVTVGTQKFPFDRLFIELDRLIGEGLLKEEVVAQIGYSKYQPKNFSTFQFLTEDEVEKFMNSSRIVITHAGTSSIITCMKKKKKTVVIPRLSKFNEHIDDHQIEIATLFKEKNAVELVENIEDLHKKILECESKEYDFLTFDNHLLLGSIRDYILGN
jgi:UDP-N-acetylglucosamine transferase subunit ALG13